MERLVDVNGDYLGYLSSSGEIIFKEKLITERINKSFRGK